MITHKESIFIARDATAIESSGDTLTGAVKKIIPVATTCWSIFISGDIGDDNPCECVNLLNELQGQLDKIRFAYGQKTA
jgi:hypothetical protein